MPDAVRAVTTCTVVARNYLPAARVLARSYLKHNPDHDFVIAVIDAPFGESATEAGWRVVGPQEFGIEPGEYGRLATAYSITELATAVKPYLLRELRKTSDVVVFLDPDIEVFAPMAELADLATSHSIVLAPHYLTPLPRDGKEPGEAVIMGTGMFNLGFIAVGARSEGFLDFWAERLRHDAIIAPESQLFTDQRWVDQVPSLFEHLVLRDPGYDVAYWNLHERVVEPTDGGFSVNGVPLRFFHFSGYRPEKPWLLTYHCARDPRVLLSERPELRVLCDGYRDALQAAGYGETLDSIPYRFARLSDGTVVTTQMRRAYRAAWIEAERLGEQLPPPAFGAQGDQDFRDWLAAAAAPAQATAGLNRLSVALWESRIDLQLAFPQPCGAHAEAFRAWCRKHGVEEGLLPEWALPGEPPQPREPDDVFGVNVLGYLTAALGVGEMGRIVHDTIRAAGVDVVSVLEERSVSNRTGVVHDGEVGRPRFPVSLIAVNADQTQVVLDNAPEVGHNRYRIGLWAWELETLPEAHHSAFDLLDEIWTISDYCAQAIKRHATIPVKTIPVPVRDPGAATSRARAGSDPATFLFAFDFNSVAERKNPFGLIEAFQRAFPDRDDMRLVIKAINAEKHPHKAERLRMAAADDHRVTLVERYLTVAELDRLYRDADCYVSLHRSEGFGLTVAEAMARAMPVISTDYSGTTEFLDERTGWPIPYVKVAVGPDAFPYQADEHWAEPDVDAAAAAMRQVADEPELAAAKGRAARDHILSTRTTAAAAAWMRPELENAYRTWQARQSVVQGQATGVDEPLATARAALSWRADTTASSRLPLAPALRKAVLRAIDHYDVHQRTVMGAVVRGIEHVSAKLGAAEQRIAGAQLAAERRAYDDNLARDSRIDEIERELRAMKRDVAAAHGSARLRHAPVPAGADVVLCDAGALLLPVDGVVHPWLVHNRSWEPAEADLMTALVRESPGAVVDIGAHVGYHTLRLLATCQEIPAVVAVEADPVNAEFLRRNVAANLSDAVAARVTVLPVAAWDADGEVEIVRADPGNSGDNRVLPAGSGGVTVRATRLDSVAEVSAERVRLVKVDLQGRDHRAIAGLASVIERDHPDIVCEFCPAAITELGDDPALVLAGYRKLAYEPVVVGESGPVALDALDNDLIRAAESADSGFLTLWLRPIR